MNLIFPTKSLEYFLLLSCYSSPLKMEKLRAAKQINSKTGLESKKTLDAAEHGCRIPNQCLAVDDVNLTKRKTLEPVGQMTVIDADSNDAYRRIHTVDTKDGANQECNKIKTIFDNLFTIQCNHFCYDLNHFSEISLNCRSGLSLFWKLEFLYDDKMISEKLLKTGLLNSLRLSFFYFSHQ